ncbi:MAG: glycoside hydrolase family 3 C-terminal domain-containing protein [Clostridia bacterium]|nr:glycoside hydrolase family 3 C-terminal domain-containing protein [Clostridia bacterium]
MDVTRQIAKVEEEKWARHRYNLTTGIGEGGARVTGSGAHLALSRAIAAEGIVLLKNNGVLPFQKKPTVALFGIGCLDYVKCGGGSGRVFAKHTYNLYEGLLAKPESVTLYEPSVRHYYDFIKPQLATYSSEKLFPEIAVPRELIADAAAHADVAVISIHRFSGEGQDRTNEKGDFLLSEVEEELVRDVTAAFDRSVVVLNVGGIIDMTWIENNPKIDAALLAWQGGTCGALAVADVLCGDVNPSGKLTDTVAKTLGDYPFVDSFHESRDYVCYFEDIFVGYRYFETFPEARDKVVYPFGYGLSYTDFSLTKPVASETDGQIEVCVTVKNVGKEAGKEVVQVYCTAPQGVLGKSRLSLVGFHKTALLAPGEAEDVTVRFSAEDLASYDDLGKLQASSYVLEGGEYAFCVGTSCRDLQTADFRYEVKEAFRVTRALSQKCAPNALEKRLLSDGTFEALPSFPVLDHSDAVPEANTAVAPESEKPLPLRYVASGRLSLDVFLAQMTDEELMGLVGGIPSRGLSNTCGIGGIERLGIPAVMTADGPAGLRISPGSGIETTAWPCATMVACTWNTDLVYRFGRAAALEVKENGFGVWLAPALNIHRNPICGRNFEYFSEDPLLSGKLAAAEVNGIQSVHVAASAKHFACNNKETNRTLCDSRVSERALREIYLRGFEICVRESQPWTVMCSYNITNGRRCCTSYEQLVGILRDEWGFDGMLTTDWGTPCNQEDSVLNQCDLTMPSGKPYRLKAALEAGPLRRAHLEACARRILQMILKLD